MYGILIGINLPAPLLGLEFQDDSDRQRLWYEPPGYVIPLAWFILFAMLAVARTKSSAYDPGGHGSRLLIGLAVLCAAYAYYTLGLSRLTGISALWFGLAGNLAVIAASLYTAWIVSAVSAVAGLMVLPVALWTLFATAIVVGQMRVQGLIG